MDKKDQPIPKRISEKDLKSWQRSAMLWYRSKIKDTNQATASDIISKKKEVNTPLIGQMVLFAYDAKLKEKLPYWDMYPLSIILDIRDDSFLSLNVHYLDYTLRQVLIEALLKTINDDRWDHRSKAKINYSILKSVSKYKIAQPALKMHLFSQIKTKVVRIQPIEWRDAIYLPIEKFQKASSQKVWNDSRKNIS